MTDELEMMVEEEEEITPRALTVTQGDITMLQLPNGAIVNPSNTGLILSSGVSEQIGRRAGPFFQQKLHTERTRLPHNRLEPGRVLATEPGQLKCKQLLHVSIVGKKKVDQRLVTNALLNIYDKAEALGLDELAIPALGVGVGKFLLDEFLDLFWKITMEELPRSESLTHVILCLFDEGEFDVAQNYIEAHLGELPEAINLEITRGNFWGGL